MKLSDAVYVTGHGTKVGVEKGSLVVTPRGSDRVRIPLAGIEQVVMLGSVSVSDAAFARCAQAGVRVASLSRSGRLRYALDRRPDGNVLLRVAQVRAFDNPEHSLVLSRSFVVAKLLNSRRAVARWRWDAQAEAKPHLVEIEQQLTSRVERAGTAASLDELRGVEGDAARLYFKAVGAVVNASRTGFTFDQRTRRPPRSPFNAALSFGYGLITNEVVGALQSVGLDSQIGFLHRLRPGRPSLALDMTEELRSPLVDRFVVAAIGRRQLRLEHFQELPGGAWQLHDGGRAVFFSLWEAFRLGSEHHAFLDRDIERWAIPTTQALLLARHLRGDLDGYPAWIRVN
jgi:CRISP-associated protein Cas1